MRSSASTHTYIENSATNKPLSPAVRNNSPLNLYTRLEITLKP